MKETINFKGIEFDIEFDYQPEEKEVLYYADGSGHPGSSETLTIRDITHKETSFLNFLADEKDEIEEELIIHVRNG